jgi:steroid Delta-isomerase
MSESAQTASDTAPQAPQATDAAEHPARAAANRSRAAVGSKNKEAWLALFDDDALIEDPIGVSPIDPIGKGIRGKANISEFWDQNIAPNTHTFEVHQSYAAGLEVANHMTLKFLIGTSMQAEVNGVFTYRVNEAGKIIALRGFWELAEMMKTMREAD